MQVNTQFCILRLVRSSSFHGTVTTDKQRSTWVLGSV